MTEIIGIIFFFITVVLLGGTLKNKSNILSNANSILLSLGLLCIGAGYFWLFGIEIKSSLYILVLIVMLLNIKRINWQSMLLILLYLLVSFFFTVSPILLRFGNNFGVSGYMVSNDAVIHAVYSKGCAANSNNYSKIYDLSTITCAYNYSSASHSLLNLISSFPKVDQSQMIIFLNFAVLPFVGILIYLLLIHLEVDKFVAVICSFFTSQLYLLFNFSAYGFLPQTLFVPLFLGSLFMLFQRKLTTQKTSRLFYISVLIASSVIVYGFVTYIPYFIALATVLFINYPFTKVVFKRIVLLIIFTFILMGPHIISNTSTIINVFKFDQVFSEQFSSPGNLTGFLPVKMLSGISGRIDYRYDSLDPMATKLLEPASVIFLGLAILGIYFLVKFRQKTVLLMIVTISISTLLVQVITNSPYSVSKMLSLLAPLVYISSVYAIWQISKKNTLISVFFVLIYGSLMILGNFRVIKSISYISSDDLNDLGALSKLIPENASVYFATDNDWAIYYLDSENVYLDGIHYMRDVIPEGKQYDYYIYPNTSDFECAQVSETKNFKVCSNPISPKN